MRLLWWGAAGLSVGITSLAIGAALWPTPPVPSFADTKARFESSDVDVLDRQGRLLTRVRRDFSSRRLVWQSLENLPPHVVENLIRSEDRGFREHRGLDGRALAASLWQRLRHGSSRGGSTLTMQLGRLLEPALSGAEFGRKLAQVKFAILLDRAWSKDQILEAYLNLAPFRGEARGLEAAAWSEFRVQATQLEPAESAWLISRLRGPNASFDTVRKRACWLRAERCTEITELARKLAATRAPPRRDERALHFSYRVSAHAQGGSIKTRLDPALQDFAERSLRRQLREIRAQNVKDGAILVLENATGEVLAYVGSSGSLSEAPEVDGVKAVRQAGSTLKPFLYALAFQRGSLEAESWIEDAPTDLTFPSGVYRPRNHDREFRGWVRAREALGSSLNVPAVKTLSMMPLAEFWQLLKDLGFEGLKSADEYGPALALGVADVTLWDLTNAYRSLANRGVYRSAKLPGRGDEPVERRVFREDSVLTVEDILARPENRVLGFGLEGSRLRPPFRAAFKTGTSKDMRDNWCVGWTKDYTIGVWVGNFDGEPMWDVSGLSGAAPVWIEIASELHRRSPQDLHVVPARAASVAGPVRAKRPRILYPQDGLILARDPDIPERAQKVPLVTDTAGRQDLSWYINGKFHAEALGDRAWSPVKGRHRIELSDGKNVFEKVEIQVK